MKEWGCRGAVSDRGSRCKGWGRSIKDPRKRGDETGWSKVRGTHAKEREAERWRLMQVTVGLEFYTESNGPSLQGYKRYASVYIL